MVPAAQTGSPSSVRHAVLAYSGGLDTSVAIAWLKENFHCKVTCMTVDMGQGTPKEVVQRAIHNGAEDVITVAAREPFLKEFVAPSLKANALYEGVYPLATALGRPLIARELVKVARNVAADAVAHGCTGKGNDQVRIEAGVRALAPDLRVIAPQRLWPVSRAEEVRWAQERKLDLPATKTSLFSTDENPWGRSVEGGDIEDVTKAVPAGAWAWTTDATKAPNDPATVTIGFEKGLPVSLDGKATPFPDVVDRLNTLAGVHGIGRIDHVESRVVGVKSREVYEAPAAVTLIAAHRALEALTLDADVLKAKTWVETEYAGIVYGGKWFTPYREALQAFVDRVQTDVTGSVTLRLYKGSISLAGRSSPNALYRHDLATYGAGDAFKHGAAEGFIELYTLPMALRGGRGGA